jgi:proteasome activator subunit 4
MQIPALVKTANEPDTHWKYSALIAYLLRQLLRRDKATSGPLADWFMNNIPDSQPDMRRYALAALVRILYFIKLRTLCDGSPERLYLQQGDNPLKRKIRLEDTSAEFTRQYLDSFKQKVPYDTQAEHWMQDKPAEGWLCWGKEIQQSRLAGWDEQVFTWEADSGEAIQAIGKHVEDDEWWKRVRDVRLRFFEGVPADRYMFPGHLEMVRREACR